MHLIDSQQTREAEAPEDAHYRSLRADLSPLDPTSDEFKMVKKYVQNTHGKTHNDFSLELEDVFALSKVRCTQLLCACGNMVVCVGGYPNPPWWCRWCDLG